MEILHLDRLLERLQALRKAAEADAKNSGSVVGYTQSYALAVHENLEARHKAGKQAKYLEEPARRLSRELGQLISATYKQTKSMPKSTLMAALRLLRESQIVCPVDTGALRASGFAANELNAEQAATAAYSRAQVRKQRKRK